jgi:hypothetical protein
MARLTLNDHLFEVMENLTDRSIKGEELQDQIRRADAAAKIAQQIIAGQNFALKATLAALDHGVMLPDAKSKLKLLAE